MDANTRARPANALARRKPNSSASRPALAPARIAPTRTPATDQLKALNQIPRQSKAKRDSRPSAIPVSPIAAI